MAVMQPPEQLTQAKMKAGTALVYSESAFHGGGASTSDQDRIGINITYALGVAESLSIMGGVADLETLEIALST